MKHNKNLIAGFKNLNDCELEIIVESVKFSGKIIINNKNSKIMKIKIAKLKIKPFRPKIYHIKDNNNLVESIKELTTGRDPPEIFPFRS
jgi:hypothetical protein